MEVVQKFKFCFCLLCCLICVRNVSAQQREISGVVISSEDKEPLIGATVNVKGQPGKGVITDIDGKFLLPVEEDVKTLVVTYMGMKTVEVQISKVKKDLKVVLEPESLNIEEVVVTGYGNYSKSSFTGSANTLRTDMLKEVPVMSMEQKLQGMTTGVEISSSSGQPGARQNIRIRGMGSFNASQEPLFVIDGVPVSSGSLSSGGSDAAYMNNSKTNIMSTLNPSDIENVTIIKDAAAASLYGSRAANGVILITTKKGRSGRVSVDLNVSGGFSNAAVDFRPTLNGDQREELLYEGLVNYATDNGMTSPADYARMNIGTYAYKPELGYTDWRKELLRTAGHQSYEASVSGGSERTNFYASLGYNKQEGLAKNSSLNRYSARLNLTQKVGKYGEVGGNMMFSQMNQEMNEERGSSINPYLDVAMIMTPSMLVRDEKGNYTGAYEGTNLNPLRDMLTDYNRVRMTRMFSTGYASVEPVKGLKLKEMLSYDYTVQKDARYYNPLSSAGPKSGGDAQTAKGFIEYGKFISSTSLNYIHTFGRKHHLDVLAAYEIESYQTDYASGEKSKLPTDKLTEPDNAAVLNRFGSSSQAYRMISYLSRLNYDYDDRYYIAGSFRRDGSSRLSPDNRWGNFWSVSGMWHLGNEKFMQGVKPILSDVKLRASYGVNGNQPGSFYSYKGLYSYGQNYMEAAGSYESSQPNNLLTWEKNYSLNVGLDLAFINRIFVSLEYYNRDTKDLLYNLPISATTGFTSYLSNIGHLNNKGVELELHTLNVVSPNFNWTSVFNLSHNENKIISLNGQLEQSIEKTWYIHKVGLPYYTFYVKEFAGVDAQTGSALYYLNTTHEDGSYNRELTTDANAAQAVPYKSVNPKVSGGLTNMLNYKWFDLTFTLTYSLGGYSFDKLGTYIENGGKSIYDSKYNLPVYALDRWQQPGDRTDVPRFVYGESATSANSSRYIHSTDHLRLKNLTLGFSLPEQWLRKMLIDKARIYFSGSNLLTWSKWKQYDPETPINGEVFCEAPPMRSFSFGVQLSF